MHRYSSLEIFKKIPRLDWLLILAFALIRLLISFRVGLGVDEAHYALYGLRLDWSYFDHPPMVGWINAAFLAVFGVHDWVVRLPANLCGVLSSILVFQIARIISQDLKTARWVMAALNVSFLPAGLFIMFLPDTILLPLTLWLALIAMDLVQNPRSFPSWIQLGICIGLCGLTKYTSGIFIVSLLGIGVTQKVWKQWLSWRLLVSIFIAGICVLPVIYWNQKNHWISFAYQGGHVLGQRQFMWSTFGASLFAQLLAYSPFIVIPTVFGLFGAKKIKPLSKICLWLALPCFLFFAYSGFTNFVLPHWNLIVYALFFVVGASENFEKKLFKKSFKLGVLLTACLGLLLQFELFAQVFPFHDYQSPYSDLTGWPEMRQDLVEYKHQHPDKAFSVGVANWTLGSRAVYYFSGVTDVFVLDQRQDQFDLWESGKTPAADVMLLSWHDFKFEVPLEKMCTSSEKFGEEHVFRGHGYIITSAGWILCHGFNYAAAIGAR